MGFIELFEKLPDDHVIHVLEHGSTSIFRKSFVLTSKRLFDYYEWFKELNDQVETFFYYINSKGNGELKIYIKGSGREMPY